MVGICPGGISHGGNWPVGICPGYLSGGICHDTINISALAIDVEVTRRIHHLLLDDQILY